MIVLIVFLVLVGIAVVAFGVLVLIGFGYELANDDHDRERRALATQFRTMEQIGQVREIELETRRAMQAEALRQLRGNSGRPE